MIFFLPCIIILFNLGLNGFFAFFIHQPLTVGLEDLFFEADKNFTVFLKITPFFTHHNGKDDKIQATKKPRFNLGFPFINQYHSPPSEHSKFALSTEQRAFFKIPIMPAS